MVVLPTELHLSATAAEHGTEEIGVVLTTEIPLELRSPGSSRWPTAASLCPACFLEFLRVLPMLSICIVLLTVLRIAQDLMRFVDLLELPLRLAVVRVQVRMVLACEFAVCRLDRIGVGVAVKPKHLVVVHRHGVRMYPCDGKMHCLPSWYRVTRSNHTRGRNRLRLEEWPIGRILGGRCRKTRYVRGPLHHSLKMWGGNDQNEQFCPTFLHPSQLGVPCSHRLGLPGYRFTLPRHLVVTPGCATAGHARA